MEEKAQVVVENFGNTSFIDTMGAMQFAPVDEMESDVLYDTAAVKANLTELPRDGVEAIIEHQGLSTSTPSMITDLAESRNSWKTQRHQSPTSGNPEGLVSAPPLPSHVQSSTRTNQCFHA